MTTASGGNISILDRDGSIWITPASIDKGSLIADDIVCVLTDGSVRGRHAPSSELPFHAAVYKARPDIGAIVHAHPPALVAFAITRKIPDTRILPLTRKICGEVGYAKYALPGSVRLGELIAQEFASSHDTVVLENHGVVTVGSDLLQAFQKFETVNLCAHIVLNATRIGTVHVLNEEELGLTRTVTTLDAFSPNLQSEREQALRKMMILFVRRIYEKKMVTSSGGTLSARIDASCFLITPEGLDWNYLTEDDLVLIRDGKSEAAKRPDASVSMHRIIYAKHTMINSIVIAYPPNMLAFSVSDAVFDSRTIPESYLVLRDIRMLPHGIVLGSEGGSDTAIADIVSEKLPFVICKNELIVVTGNSLLQSFDRLEVAENTAKAVIDSMTIGAVMSISSEQIDELERAYPLRQS